MVQTRFFFFIVIFFATGSCKIDRKGFVDRDKFTFRYTDDSFLFFKNVRQIYYDFQEIPQARWYAYRLSDRYQGNDRPSITPVIVINWQKNEATLLVEVNQQLEDESEIVIQEKNSKTGTWYSYSLKERGKENMLEFATKIYEGIMAENELLIKIGDRSHSLFPEEEDRDHYRVVLADYYRLTRIF
jgi:hypothetical protein